MAKACSLEWTQNMSRYNEIIRCAQNTDAILSPIDEYYNWEGLCDCLINKCFFTLNF